MGGAVMGMPDLGRVRSALQRLPGKIKLRKPSGLKLAKPGSVKLSRPGRVLVFETTGYALYGAVAHCGATSAFTVDPPAVSRRADFREAVGEVLEQLRQKSKRLPKKAVLVTPSAGGDLLRLPVNPKNPRTRVQMGEMVRWELEELLVRQGDLWSLGGLLVGRGYLAPELRRELEGCAAGDRRARSGPSLFNEHVTADQLQECQGLQELLAAGDEELMTGCAPQGVDDEEEAETFAWWGGGVGDGIVGRWVSAFAKHGIFLGWIYPQFGPAVGLLEEEGEPWLLVDVRQEQFALLQGRSGELQDLAVKPCPCGRADPERIAEAARELLRKETARIFLSASAEQAPPILEELKRLCDREAALLPLPEGAGGEGSCTPEVLASLQGAARHALGIGKHDCLVRIEARTPLPPLWKRKQTYPWLAIILVMAGLAAYDWTLWSGTKKNRSALEVAEIEHEKGMKLQKEASAIAADGKRLQGELDAREAELKEQLRFKEILDNVVRHRQVLVPGVLRGISAAATDEVVLDFLEERGDRSGFYMEGWALRDTDGQLFAKRLNEKLAQWGYMVGDVDLSRGGGRLKIDGFILKLWLVKAAPPAEAKND
jgi:hypothetical protein